MPPALNACPLPTSAMCPAKSPRSHDIAARMPVAVGSWPGEWGGAIAPSENCGGNTLPGGKLSSKIAKFRVKNSNFGGTLEAKSKF